MDLNIRKKGSPILSQVAIEIPKGEPVGVLVDMMFAIMYQKKGIGLAANQVGRLQRVFVMHANGLKQEFINPVIVKRYGGKVTGNEGCLSFPSLKALMVRDKQIIIEGFDKNWKPVRRKLKGLAAICAQHEFDHLNGKTIGDVV